MANLTLTIDDGLLLRARRRALEHGTSVNALVREYLERFAGPDDSADVGRALVAIAERSSGSSGSAGRTWTREALHERQSVR
jgi:plasmid stability protein